MYALFFFENTLFQGLEFTKNKGSLRKPFRNENGTCWDRAINITSISFQLTNLIASSYFAMKDQIHLRMLQISYETEGYHLSQYCGTRNKNNYILTSFREHELPEIMWTHTGSKCKNQTPSANLSGSSLSETPQRGLLGSSGESQESFSAESLSPAAEIWVIKIARVDRGSSWPGNRIRSTNSSTDFKTTITDICLYESTHSTAPSFGKPW